MLFKSTAVAAEGCTVKVTLDDRGKPVVTIVG